MTAREELRLERAAPHGTTLGPARTAPAARALGEHGRAHGQEASAGERPEGCGSLHLVQTRPIAVLASGSGTILEAILAAGIAVAVVVVDRSCRAEQVASRARVPAEHLERKSFGSDFDRIAFTDEVLAALSPYKPELVAMAGFGTILSPHFFEAYPQRVLNTHPALLPEFKGWHAVAAALRAGVEVTGCTVHLATASVDDGPILAQAEVGVNDGDTEESLAERIKAVERRLYPETIASYLVELAEQPEG